MGKAVIAVFFIVGFVVFVFIKFAAKGVKEAYKAVYKEPGTASQSTRALDEDDEVDRMVKIIAGSLFIQKAIMTSDCEILPVKAKDKWSLGYVGGYTDALLQRNGIGVDATGFAIMTIVFIMMFGEEQGPVYFRKFMDLQREEDLALFDGMKKGGEEVFTWLSDKEKLPMGWSRYVLGIS